MKKIMLTTILIASTMVLGISKTYASGWTGQIDILQLNTYHNFVFVRVTPNPNPNKSNNPDLCDKADNYFHLDKEIENYDAIYTSLLTAKVSGAKVNIFLDTCNEASKRPLVRGVAVH